MLLEQFLTHQTQTYAFSSLLRLLTNKRSSVNLLINETIWNYLDDISGKVKGTIFYSFNCIRSDDDKNKQYISTFRIKKKKNTTHHRTITSFNNFEQLVACDWNDAP